MNSSIEYLVAKLKEERKKKGLSQRELSVKIGVPQSHISKIEKGLVDLQVSSLLEMARTLEMDLMLVPRQLIPTFKSLLQQGDSAHHKQRPMYRLDTDEEEDDR